MSYLLELDTKGKYLAETLTKSLKWLNNLAANIGEGGLVGDIGLNPCPNNWGGRKQIKQAIFDLTGEWVDCPPMRGDHILPNKCVWDVDMPRTRRLRHNRADAKYYLVVTDPNLDGIWVKKHSDGLNPVWIQVHPSQMKD